MPIETELVEEIKPANDLTLILKEIEKNRELPAEERDYLRIYLILENFIINSRAGYTAETLRDLIRNKFNVQWFSPRLKVLFNLKDCDNLIFLEIILGAILKCLSQDYPELTKRVVNEVTKNQLLLKDIIIKKEKIDFAAVEKRIFASKTQFGRAIKELNELLTILHEYFTRNIGASQTKKIFSDAFNEVKRKYANIPKFSDTVKALPSGVLETEKFSFLSKDELDKASKKLAAIDTMKTEFTNIAAHELRTPLIPILGYIERLLREPKKFKLTRETQEHLEICLRNAKRLNYLIEDILTISKLESREMKFYIESLDLKNIINDVKVEFLHLAKEKRLSLNLELPSYLPNVMGDKQRITQVLANLVENAVKFTEKGPVTISAKQKLNKVLIKVKDTGIGIGKEDIPKLFSKYFQKSATEGGRGTGLGLVICKEIVEQHNGKIWVESEPEKGSSFYFTLPIKK